MECSLGRTNRNSSEEKGTGGSWGASTGQVESRRVEESMEAENDRAGVGARAAPMVGP